jgi:hypothetical protein
MYVTPKRFKKMGLGISLTGIPDHELREHLMTAAAAVDAYCNVPVYPQRHSFKGGSIVGEQQGWVDHYRRRVYPLHTPLKEVSRIQIDATNNLYVDFNDEDFYLNRLEGYVELINFALTKVGIWGQADVPALGLSQPVAVLDYTYGHIFPVVDEELIALPASSGEEDWSEYMAINGYWDAAATVEIKKNGGILATNEYDVDYDSGFVTLTTPATEIDELTASYTYRVPWEVARANALGAASFVGESKLLSKGMSGIESLEVEEVRIRRIGSRSGAEKGVALPSTAQQLLNGYVFMTIR